MQAIASGDVRDLVDLRRIIARSSQLATYEPSAAAEWDRAYDRFKNDVVVT